MSINAPIPFEMYGYWWELGERFVVFLLTIPKQFLCCSFPLCGGSFIRSICLSLFVPYLSFWYLGRAVLCDCGISWVSSLIFLVQAKKKN